MDKGDDNQDISQKTEIATLESSHVSEEAESTHFRFLPNRINEMSDRQKMRLKIAVLSGMAVYMITVALLTGKSQRTIFIILLIAATTLFENSRKVLKDWGVFIILLSTYDLMRGFAENVGPRVHVKDIYDWELAVTGWFTGGRVLPFMFQEYKLAHAGELHVQILNIITGIIYANHIPVPLIIAALIYWKSEDKSEYWRMATTFLITSYMGFLTFIILPAAPPWYVWNNGNGLRFTPPETGQVIVNAAGLKDLSSIAGLKILASAFENLNANPYAAVPSLHGAYSVIAAIFAIRRWGKKAAWMVLFPVAMWFSTMWLNHHYLIDLIWGAAYVVIAYPVSLKLVDLVQKRKSRRDATDAPKTI